MPRPAAVADLLAAIFKDKPAGKRLHEGKIWLVWDMAVGEQIAAHARPVGFRDGVLNVAVDSAPWMQQLTYLKKQIVAKLNKRLGEELVIDLFLKAGTVSPPRPVQAPVKPLKTLSPDENAHIDALTSQFDDKELRDSMAKLMKSHYKDRS